MLCGYNSKTKKSRFSYPGIQLKNIKKEKIIQQERCSYKIFFRVFERTVTDWKLRKLTRNDK